MSEADCWRKVEADTAALGERIISKFAMLPESDQFCEWRAEGKIFSVWDRDRSLYPAFQFDENGRPLISVAQVLAIL